MMQLDWRKSVQQPSFWFVALAGGLALLHLTLLDKSKLENLFSLSFLMWLTVASLLWDKRDRLVLESNLFSTCLGSTLLMFVLLRNLHSSDTSLRILPLVGGIGIMLIASGTKHLKDYYREIIILSLLVVARLVAVFLQSINLSLWTAKFSAFALWVAGFPVYRQGVFIELPLGRVEVYGACSGVESILLMFCVAILFLFLIPINHLHKLICIIVAVSIGFIINALRVSLLAFLVNANNTEAFDYWHGSDGSLLFAVISVCLFGVYCWFAHVQHFNVPPASGEN
jgi:cyanoexosortase A